MKPEVAVKVNKLLTALLSDIEYYKTSFQNFKS